MYDDYKEAIVPSFYDLYKINLIDENIDYDLFISLLSGLHDTKLNLLIETRTETDREKIRNFGDWQKGEWTRWQKRKFEKMETRQHKDYTYEDYIKIYGDVSKILEC